MSPFDPTVSSADFRGYKAGDDGSVWTCKDTRGRRTKWWRPLSQQVNRKGYHYVALSFAGRVTLHHVARVVLTAFVGPRPAGHDACHKNDVRSDNRLVNLEWDTHANNVRQRDRLGRTACGAANGRSRLTAEGARAVSVLSALGFSQREVARRVGTPHQNVHKILAGKAWRRALNAPAEPHGREGSC